MDEIYEGTDELGALLMGHERGAYWYGSQVKIEQALKLGTSQVMPAWEAYIVEGCPQDGICFQLEVVAVLRVLPHEDGVAICEGN